MKNSINVIYTETEEIEQEAAISSTAHFLSGRRWANVNILIGVPATLLAGATGVSAFTDSVHDYITGLIAIIVAGLTALNTFLNPGDRATSHRSANITYRKIRRDASLFKDVDLPLAKDKGEEVILELVKSLKALSSRINAADQDSPVVFLSSQDKARKDYKKKIIDTQVDLTT